MDYQTKEITIFMVNSVLGGHSTREAIKSAANHFNITEEEAKRIYWGFDDGNLINNEINNFNTFLM